MASQQTRWFLDSGGVGTANVEIDIGLFPAELEGKVIFVATPRARAEAALVKAEARCAK